MSAIGFSQKYFPAKGILDEIFFSFFFVNFICHPGTACQSGDAALERVKSAISSYQAKDSNAFDVQLTNIMRQSGSGCPEGLQYGCLQLAYQNFAAAQNTATQSPESFTFLAYDKQTTPEIRMVLVEGNWGGSPSTGLGQASPVISCQVFFVATDGSIWLIDNFDAPQAMTCQQRSEELTKNLYP